MTRSELIQAIAVRFPQLNKTDCEISVKEITDAICQSLTQGGRVEIRGFGSFSLSYRPPRLRRNPKTGDPVAVLGKHAPYFKPAKHLRDSLKPAIGQFTL